LAISACPIPSSALSYEARLALPIEQRRLAAHRMAAEVRHRKPHMQMHRLTPLRDWNGEVIV
jgi:hypothetical protein